MATNKAIDQVENADGASISENKVRDVRNEALNLRTQALTIASSTIKGQEDAEIKALQKPTGTAYHCDLFIAHINTLMVPEAHPQVSRFLKYSQHLFYVNHLMDDLLCSNRQFCQTNKQWNPLISRYYYAVLDVIQTLRAMDEADILDQEDRLFLNQFMNRFPPQSLSIAGPLVSYFQSICVSECQYPSFGVICPILPHPNQYHPRHEITKYPLFTYVNYMIPNIPGIVSMINQLGTIERQQQLMNGTLLVPFNPMQSITVNNQQHDASLNGVTYSSSYASLTDEQKWYFTSPGMEYPNEADPESLKAFSQQVYKYGFKQITRTDTFGKTAKYLLMETPHTFARVNAIMAKVNKHFSNSGTLAHCPPRGVNAGQVICTRTVPEEKPVRYGDESDIIEGSFEALTVNHTLTQLQAQFAFASKINSNFEDIDGGHHPLNGIGTRRHVNDVRKGPFWNSSTLTLTSGLDEGYLRYPEIVRTKYYLEKPEN